MPNSLHEEQHSSSLPSSTNTRISATSSSSSYQSSSEHYLPFVSIMNQSTIYRRHEARLARSYALKDDPRPAVLRVLSGLPITNMIVPPYQPEDSESHHKDHMPERQRQQHHHRLGDYSEETVFSTASEEEQPHLALDTRNASNNVILQPALQAMMAVGVGATVGEFLFGGHYRRKRVTSPFEFPSSQQHQSHNTMHSSLVRGNVAAAAAANADSSSLGVQLVKTSSQQQDRPTTLSSATTRAASSATLKPSTFIWRSAATTGLMFGSKVMTEQYLSTTSDKNGSTTFATSTLSSAVAGAVTGMVEIATQLTKAPSSTSTRIMTQPQSMFPTTSPALTSTPSQILSRQILAATLYFATYDTLTNNNTSKTYETPSCASTPQILFAGATAGVVHATTLSMLSQNRTAGQIVPMAVRAAPIHAMIFLAYESMRQGMKIQN